VRWVVLLWAATVGAQPLDLRVVPVTHGVVQSIREIHAHPQSAAPRGSGPQTVGAPSDIEEALPVGAVAALPFGVNTTSADHKWRFGAAGTEEMQERLARTAFEVTVRMDDGERRVLRIADPSRVHVGQRVSVRSGNLEPLER
jgi:hypothetical protein